MFHLQKQITFMMYAITLVLFSVSYSAPISQAFSYQGHLTMNGVEVDGFYDFQFKLYSQPDDATPVGVAIYAKDLEVAEGHFSVILDFGDDPALFDGARWLEIGLRPSNSGEDYTVLEPRQEILSVPYALHAKWDSGDSGGVPIGTVIDWWRPNSQWTVPDGYAVCDGSVVDDPESPLNGETLPDLQDRFIRGTTHMYQIGNYGGSDTHSHTVDIDHDHASTNTSSAGAHSHSISSAGGHSHSVDLPSFSGSSGSAGRHRHIWSVFDYSDKTWHTWDESGTYKTIGDWGNGLDEEGSGLYPLISEAAGLIYTHYTDYQNEHSHSINHDHPATQSSYAGIHSHTVSTDGNHAHSVDLPALGTTKKTTDSNNNLPQYYTLLKIMRIK